VCSLRQIKKSCREIAKERETLWRDSVFYAITDLAVFFGVIGLFAFAVYKVIP
jgi:hypothetical protein